MPLFRRRAAAPPVLLPLPFPRLDGSTWPDAARRGRGSFAASTLYALARQHAFTDEAHGVTDVVVDGLLPLLRTGAAPEDAAHMQRVCAVAAQIGAAVGFVERTSVHGGDEGDGTAADVAGVLQLAADDLPSMPPHQTEVARYLLQCGYYLARTGTDRLALLVAALRQEQHPAVRSPSSPRDP